MSSRAQARLDAILSALPQIIIYLDGEGRILGHNTHLAELLTPASPDVRGSALIDQLHPWSSKDAVDLARFLQLPLSEGEQIRLHYGFALKTSWSSRGVFRAELGSTDSEKVDEYFLILEDVTSLRQMEEEYRRVQRIHNLLPLLKGFGSDFRERLTVMYGSLDFLLQTLPSESEGYDTFLSSLDEQIHGLLRHLGHSNSQVENMLLAVSGENRGAGEFSLLELIREAGEQAVLGSNKRFEISGEKDLPTFHGDFEKIFQLFQNVLVNAVQSGAAAFPVKASLESVNRRGRDFFLCSIQDRGEGMSLDIISRAEQPFFTTKDNADGLGLFIAKNIALEHNGTIDLESSPGKGATVHVYLPKNPAETTRLVERKIPEGLRILIMEDNQEIRDVWQRLLYQLGIQGVYVGTAAQAFEKFESALNSDYPFHLVILEDSESEIPDVFQLLMRLRRLDANIPAIYSSSLVRYGLEQLRSRGFSAFLKKPFRIFELQNALVKTLYANADKSPDGEA